MEKSGKRKAPASTDASNNHRHGNGRSTKRVRLHDARSIVAQTSDEGLNRGELDLQAFMTARQFEIEALEDAMQRSKGVLTTRAFQQVPREMRRRTASHNVKRVPKRLRKRAAREMRDDNTPTRRRKPGTSRSHIRAETAKKLSILSTRKKELKAVKPVGAKSELEMDVGDETGEDEPTSTAPRNPRAKMSTGKLRTPPNTGAPFRRRQIHKTWLPTHVWHAKRAEMTPPTEPLWRFALPLRPTAKAYRISHRASSLAGAMCWDTSYMSTIGLEGTESAIKAVLLGIGVGADAADPWQQKGAKWRAGKRVWRGWISVLENAMTCTRRYLGPTEVIWSGEQMESRAPEHPRRKAFLRSHPSIFLELWTEVLQLSKRQRPLVSVHDLRFDIGSIELTGPGSTEALLGILHPHTQDLAENDLHTKTFRSLAGLTNPSSLPPDALLGLSVIDPRLRYPPRRYPVPKATDEDASFALLETVSSWPADNCSTPSSLFDARARLVASHLPSQKAINRRKGLALPGTYPPALAHDPAIPILLLSSRSGPSPSSTQGSWTLLAPWKCILPIWYLLMHYPLSTGGNPRFGGQYQLNQISFERGEPQFPHDFPGLAAGWTEELRRRAQRKKYLDRRPAQKKVSLQTLDLGPVAGKGEVGLGWACDFDVFSQSIEAASRDTAPETSTASADEQPALPYPHISRQDFVNFLRRDSSKSELSPGLATVRITLLTRGVFGRNARIYRLPLPAQPAAGESGSTADLTSRWLALLPSPSANRSPAAQFANPKTKSKRINTLMATLRDPDVPQHEKRRQLARSLLGDVPLGHTEKDTADGQDGQHPPLPGAGDLIGFVTSGEFNLCEGKSTAIGSVYVPRVVESVKNSQGRSGRLCILRNAGETVGRLAVWDAA